MTKYKPKIKRKYTVIGAGAMGLRYGVLLQQAGAKVDFVDPWEPQVEAIRKQRGVFVSQDGLDKHLVPLNIYYPDEYNQKTDILIFFTKQYQLQNYLKICSHFFNSKQYVMTCMNGMGHIEKLNEYFSPNKILAGTALMGTILNQPGDVNFVGTKGSASMNLANETEKPDEMTYKIISDLKKAGLHPTLTKNFLGTLMVKMIVNAVTNTTCTLFKIPLGKFVFSPVGKELAVPLINEFYEVCKRSKISLLESPEKIWEMMSNAMKNGDPLHFPSMYQDFINHRKTEVDYINGYIYSLGKKHHYLAKTNNFLRNLVHLAEFTQNFQLENFKKEILNKK